MGDATKQGDESVVVIHPGRVLMCESEFDELKTIHPFPYQGKELIIVPDDTFESMSECEKMELLIHY